MEVRAATLVAENHQMKNSQAHLESILKSEKSLCDALPPM